MTFTRYKRHNTSTSRLGLSKDAFLKASPSQKQRFGTVFKGTSRLSWLASWPSRQSVNRTRKSRPDSSSHIRRHRTCPSPLIYELLGRWVRSPKTERRRSPWVKGTVEFLKFVYCEPGTEPDRDLMNGNRNYRCVYGVWSFAHIWLFATS